MPADPIRVLDLFSGIGGFAVAFDWAGAETVAFAEVNPSASLMLQRLWPGIPNLGDVREIRGEDVVRRFGTVDVLCGGFPCQDISAAGKGEGIEGARSGLWFEMLRIVREVRPAWVLAENVSALRTRGADTVLAGLESAGYTARAIVVGAWAVGAPHRRDRAWIVAHRDSDAVRIESGWRSGQDWAEASELGFDGARMADTQSQRCREARRYFDRSQKRTSVGREGMAHRDRDRSQGTEHAIDRQGAPGVGRRLADAGDAAGMADGNSGGRELQRFGGIRQGFSVDRQESLGGWSDADGRHRWPARPGEAQREWEAPRTVEPSVGGPIDGVPTELVRRVVALTSWDSSRAEAWAIRNKVRLENALRKEALKALGNSIVPQVAAPIARFIVEQIRSSRCADAA